MNNHDKKGSNRAKYSDLISPGNKIKYGTLTFQKILGPVKYDCIYNKDKKNSYQALSAAKDSHGIYFFVSSNDDTVLYIGEAHGQTVYERIQQHFRDKDSGGLRNKLSEPEKDDLYRSSVYIYECNEIEKRELLYAECFLIGKCKPQFNFKFKSEEKLNSKK